MAIANTEPRRIPPTHPGEMLHLWESEHSYRTELTRIQLLPVAA
jgi:hypothetical protein